MAKRAVYCWELKTWFSSLKEAALSTGAHENSIISVINNPNRISGDYHWCDSENYFDGVDLTKYNGKSVYCYETKEKFESTTAAAKWCGAKSHMSISYVVDKPDRSAFGYHWCTDLSIFDGVELTSKQQKVVYCYETKERFASLSTAVESLKLESLSSLRKCVNKPHLTCGGYHWCTDLSIFDGKELDGGTEVPIYCYETKEKFSSITKAAKEANLTPSFSKVVNDPNHTAGGYHWCTDLSIFDGVELVYPLGGSKVIVYCYETKEKFDSLTAAAAAVNLSDGNSIKVVLNNPANSAKGYHWCTDLGIFDGVELTKGQGKIVYCHETKEKFGSITEAAQKIKGCDESIRAVVNNPDKTSGGYHWCTSLDVFDRAELIYPDSGVSGPEKRVLDFVKTLSNNIMENSRKVITPYELDIYLPDHDFAIEFNGIYWHSEAGGKTKDYHIMKTNRCNEKGISLLHIFEHQWESKSEIFKSVINNKLGKSNKIYARKCKVVELKDCREFLENNHLQGNCPSLIKLGLIYNDELVSVMTFGKSRFNKNYQYELIRFCNKLNTLVVGGASKLLKYFETNYKPESLISYANLQWSKGNLYNKLGFTQLSISEPNYWWVKDYTVLTRYQCQKHKLANLLGDKFDPELSEKDNMEKAGYSRLFDCGNNVLVKNF